MIYEPRGLRVGREREAMERTLSREPNACSERERAFVRGEGGG